MNAKRDSLMQTKNNCSIAGYGVTGRETLSARRAYNIRFGKSTVSGVDNGDMGFRPE
jgi:hypothetical protein